MEEKYILYVAKDGDNLSTIVKDYKSGSLFPIEEVEIDPELTWERVWEDYQNHALRKNKDRKGDLKIGDYVYLPYIKRARRYKSTLGTPTHISCYTGKKELAIFNGFRPIVDAHMHIQSLHATPMTLQWATGFIQAAVGAGGFFGSYDKASEVVAASKLIEGVGRTRLELANVSAAFVKDFGKIGRLSTDLVAKVYMMDSKNSDMKKSLYWLKWSDEEIAKYETEKNERDMLREAGELIELEQLSSFRKNDFEEFEKRTAYYYRNTGTLHMSIVMPMDLSYAHFWGAHGLPINLPVPGSNTFYYIDDFVHLFSGRDLKRVFKNYSIMIGKELVKNIDYIMSIFFSYVLLKKIIKDKATKYIKENDLEHLLESGSKEIYDFLPIKTIHLQRSCQPLNNEEDNECHLSYNFNLQNQLDNYIYYIDKVFKKKLNPSLFKYYDVNEQIDPEDYVDHEERNEIQNRYYEMLLRGSGHEDLESAKRKYREDIALLERKVDKKINAEIYHEWKRDREFMIMFDYDRTMEAIDRYAYADQDKRVKMEVRFYDSMKNAQNDQEIDMIKAEYKVELDKIVNKFRKEVLEVLERKYKDKLTGKEYKHYIDEIPGDSTEIFEDYWLQRAYTEVSAYRYPLNLIPFYHYEPRRYYQDSSQLEQFAREIDRRHGFYNLKYRKIKLKDAEPKSDRRLEMNLVELKGENGDYYKEMFDNRYEIRSKTGENELKRHGTMEPNSIPLSKLYPDGCFMGVKVYPALGYPGDLYDRARHGHPGGDYYSNQFKTLEKLYEHLIEHNLPITSHCSPLGMSIADGFNYEIRDDIKAGKGKREAHYVRKSALYVDDTCGHPDNWERVLKKYNKLKICLAHFGGMKVWTKTDEKEKLPESPDWRKKICRLINNYPNVYTDISCYTMKLNTDFYDNINGADWNNKILSELSSEERKIIESCYYPVYFDGELIYRIEHSIPVEKQRKLQSIFRNVTKGEYDDISQVGKSLTDCIDANEKLKERILMGSDWYMAETSIKGVGDYYSRMFELLKLVTGKLDKGYDVWHQFAVINPLNYLGFLKADSSGTLEKRKFNNKDVYVVDVDRVEKMINNLKELPSDEQWKWESEVKQYEIDNFDMLSLERLNKLKKCRIYTAEEMKRDGNLMITGGL